MPRELVIKRCSANTIHSQPCGNKAMNDSDKCFLHSPEQYNSTRAKLLNAASICIPKARFLHLHLLFLYGRLRNPSETNWTTFASTAMENRLTPSQVRNHYVCYKRWEEANDDIVTTRAQLLDALQALNGQRHNSCYFRAFNMHTIQHVLPEMTIRVNDRIYVFGEVGFHRGSPSLNFHWTLIRLNSLQNKS